MKRPTNVFLTASGGVGMQWIDKNDMPLYSVWESRGKTYTAHRVPVMLSELAAYFKENKGKYKRS